MKLLENQSVLLVGLGESGLACARWALAQGAALTIVDTRKQPPGLDALQALGQSFEFGQTVDSLATQFDRIVVSPGLPPSHPLMQAVVARAAAQGVVIESELDWFADALAGLKVEQGYAPRVVAITGTNGKTTTVRMVECLARFAGCTVRAAGNISPAALTSLQDALDHQALPDVWVLECSSFQLHWTSRLSCDAAAVLNISQDHLDWHADWQEYLHDKARIFLGAKVAVLGRDDEAVMSLPVPATCQQVTFGLNAPAGQDELGVIREGGILWLASSSEEVKATSNRRRSQQNHPVAGGAVHMLMPCEALPVAGLHNAANALAALALTRALNLPMAKLLHGLRVFQGEPHRVEWVAQVDGVDFFDDSKGTNVGATVAALRGLQRPVVLIAGGLGKGQDFSPLQAPAQQYCKAVLLIGQDAECLEQALHGVVCERMSDLPTAVNRAFELARHATGAPCVLLSPACASMDMFRDYAHRAEVFIEAVQELAFERGQPC